MLVDEEEEAERGIPGEFGTNVSELGPELRCMISEARH
jgi:hypothetical protein